MIFMPPDISVIILTYNEELHIRRCIENARRVAKDIFVIDCFSTDRTVEIAKEYDNVQVISHEWPGNQADQLNWALEHPREVPIRTEWVLRLDADEYLTDELIAEIQERLPTLRTDQTGVIFSRRVIFMERWIRRGVPTVHLLRLFRYRRAICEKRLMDEHMQLLEGETVDFHGAFYDHNLNDIGWWTAKHNGYAIREAADLLDAELGIFESARTGATPSERSREKMPEKKVSEKSSGRSAPRISAQAAAKRAKKLKYAGMPLFWRAFAYFVLRYVVRLGFLEGAPGFMWHFLQGWWYRTLVDARVWQIKKTCGNDRAKIVGYLKERGIRM
ncbi:MAG: glycosyltransferase family 2 protein [Planctomycetia bacterium]|nr:glycosyltransferase family 2 protein [Planctomycetia bacterium]